MAKAGTELPVFDYREGGEIPRSPSFPQICTLVLLCGHAPDIDRHASDVRNVLKPDISLRQGEKTFHSEDKFRQIEKKSFGETSETTECPHCPESGLAITDAIASAALLADRYVEARRVVFYMQQLSKKPSQSGSEQHFVQIHAFKVDVNCWVRNVTTDLVGSADK